MYIDYNNLYDEVKLYIKEHYKLGQYLFEKDLVNHFMINEREAKDIMFDLYLDYVLDKCYFVKCPNCRYSNHEKYAHVEFMPEITIRCECCGTKYNPTDNLDTLYVVREFWYRSVE